MCQVLFRALKAEVNETDKVPALSFHLWVVGDKMGWDEGGTNVR